MLIKIHGGPSVVYRDDTHFADLRATARKQQMEWIAETGGPLDFLMHFADHELADFAHGCNWHYDSAKCFREMLLLPEPEKDNGNDIAWVFTLQLHVAIQSALMAVLPLLDETERNQASALLVPAMLTAAQTAIENYFDNALSNDFFYDTVYDESDDDMKSSASSSGGNEDDGGEGHEGPLFTKYLQAWTAYTTDDTYESAVTWFKHAMYVEQTMPVIFDKRRLCQLAFALHEMRTKTIEPCAEEKRYEGQADRLRSPL